MPETPAVPVTLTAAEVRAILADADVDCSLLTISDGASVSIGGPGAARWGAARVLYGIPGLSNAPYADRDEWTRREEKAG